MLRRLSIRNVVLIDKLDLDFHDGLSVLTGETGAGKSILLDSLGLALGARADSGLVRHGCDKCSVTATFSLPQGHPVFRLLSEQDIDLDSEELVVRRVVTADGRSRAYVNDQSVSVGLLRDVGDYCVEIQGQFDQHGLLDPTTHRATLDAHGNLGHLALTVRDHWRAWRETQKELNAARARIDKAREEEEWLRHAVDELEKLGPEEGEEERLAEERQFLMHGEKLVAALNDAGNELSRGKGAESALRGAQRCLERELEKADGRFEPIIEALDRAAIELEEANRAISATLADLNVDTGHQETVEERLFALRAAARKYNVPVDGLNAMMKDFRSQIDQLEFGEKELSRLTAAVSEYRKAYIEAGQKLHAARREAAAKLDGAINAELPPLRMEKARFVTDIAEVEENEWGIDGIDRVQFTVATNPGSPPGALNKIASGGELSRFLLALKVVLARVSAVPSLVFDEVDSGVGGATAAAIGQRLHLLAKERQILVITHSPQVAARGRTHFYIAKRETDGTMVTRVDPLVDGARREEIARMLAGHSVTAEARAAADSLLEQPN
ncbi:MULTISPECIES: DNA repair protein RecN [Thalassospira]|uniref:DNA repair protein RecN n=2 Tax=Thalassospira TaxID=168934 RepID=A0A367WA17_9PROT|nr:MULTISPECIES: DNA repair protein RecN [Thalassospira]MDG4719852.1 DNA repair protein RecN [Thalassospira sp. FZY0004]RCK38295.1 DNA recombination protein RecN [Thalassospira profundimaris]